MTNFIFDIDPTDIASAPEMSIHFEDFVKIVL